MKQLLEFLVQNIVTQPEKARIKETEEKGGKKLIIQLAKEDVPLVIGHQGKIIKAIKALLAAKNQGGRFFLEVSEN